MSKRSILPTALELLANVATESLHHYKKARTQPRHHNPELQRRISNIANYTGIQTKPINHQESDTDNDDDEKPPQPTTRTHTPLIARIIDLITNLKPLTPVPVRTLSVERIESNVLLVRSGSTPTRGLLSPVVTAAISVLISRKEPGKLYVAIRESCMNTGVDVVWLRKNNLQFVHYNVISKYDAELVYLANIG